MCHNPSGWEEVDFDHTGHTDCASCHAKDAPDYHYDGQCSDCHGGDDWADYTFNHAGVAACAGCHAAGRPQITIPVTAPIVTSRQIGP